MKRLTISFIIIVSLVACVDGFGQERFDAPVFLNGDFWQFRVAEHGEYMKTARELNGMYELNFVDARFKVFKLETNRKTELHSDAVSYWLSLAKPHSNMFNSRSSRAKPGPRTTCSDRAAERLIGISQP